MQSITLKKGYSLLSFLIEAKIYFILLFIIFYQHSMYIGIGAVLYTDMRCGISFTIQLEHQKGYNQNMDICAITVYVLYMHTR